MHALLVDEVFAHGRDVQEGINPCITNGAQMENKRKRERAREQIFERENLKQPVKAGLRILSDWLEDSLSTEGHWLVHTQFDLS